MKLDNIIVQNDEDGEDNTLSTKDYIKGVIKELDVKSFQSESTGKEIHAEKVVQSVIVAVSNENEVPDEVADSYSEMVERVTNDVNYTKTQVKSNKEKAQAEKERKKKEKEEEQERKKKEAAELAKRQESFFAAAEEGAHEAQEDFVNELQGLKDSLSEGITVTTKGQGYGLEIAEGTSDDQLGKTIGHLFQKSENSEFLTHQIQFFIGDLASAAVNRGLFKTGIEASKAISKQLDEQGRRLSPPAIDRYRRMSERTPVELRNPKADPTAYLELSNIKRPRKDDKEDQKKYQERIEKFNKDIQEVQEKLANGEYVARKDVQESAREIEYSHGLKERPDPNAQNEPTVGDLLRIHFLAGVVLEEMVGNYKDKDGESITDQVPFTNKSTGSLIWVTVEELKRMREEASSSLMNRLLTNKEVELEEVLQGFKKIEKDVKIGEDEEGKPLTENRKVEQPVYIDAFFPVAEEEEEPPKKPAKKAAKKAANAS